MAIRIRVEICDSSLTLNPKHEILNKFKARMSKTKLESPMFVTFEIQIYDLFRISYFGFRIFHIVKNTQVFCVQSLTQHKESHCWQAASGKNLPRLETKRADGLGIHPIETLRTSATA